MSHSKKRREAIEMYEQLGLDVVEVRGGHGSHLQYTVEYRGFHKIATHSMMKDSDKRARLNRIADLNRFKRIVDEIHAGGDPPLPAGVYRA